MSNLRRITLRHPHWAFWLVLLALLMRVSVPAGFMPVFANDAITLEPCSGSGPEKMAMAMPGMADHHSDKDHSGGTSMPCGFGGHAPSAMSLADPILVALAIIFIIATGFRVGESRPALARHFLRPHLRGPPASV